MSDELVADDRLAVSPPTDTFAAAQQLMRRFASLGQNCEFGFAQRAYGAEVLDLFRWASTPLPVLLALLRSRFEGIGDPDQLRIRTGVNGEYMVDHSRYGFSWHAFVGENQMAPDMIMRRECRRLPRLAEITIDDLTAGERIFVIKRDDGLSPDEVIPLLEEMRRYGQAPLLLVTLANDSLKPGLVEHLGDGLFRGYMERFADPLDIPSTTNAEAWLRLCKAAAQAIDQAAVRKPNATLQRRQAEPLQDEITEIVSKVIAIHTTITAAATAHRVRHIAFVGNCQVQALQGIYNRFVRPWTGEKAVYVDAYNPPSDRDRAAIETADLIVAQVTDWNSKYITLEDLPSHTPKHLVPAVTGSFHWPFSGQPHPRNVVPDFWPGGPYPAELGDAYLNRLISKGTKPDEAVQAYLQLDVNKMVDLDRLLEVTIDRQRQRDLNTDYAIADLILDRFREEQTFFTPFHPTLVVARHIARQFIEQLGLGETVLSRLEARLTSSPFPKEELPIHPSVARHFGLKFAGETRRYRYFTEGDFTFAEYAKRYTNFEWNQDLAIGLRHFHNGHRDLAFQTITSALQRSPGSATGHSALGVMLYESGYVEEARRELELAIQLRPTDTNAHAYLGRLLSDAGDVEGALAEIGEAVRLDPSELAFRLTLSECQTRHGRRDEALRTAQCAIDVDPSSPHAYDRMSHVLESLGRVGDALTLQYQAVSLDPANPHLHAHLAGLLARVGRLTDSERTFRKAIEINPRIAGFHNGLSHLLARMDRHDDAIEHANLATTLDSENHHYKSWLTELNKRRVSDAMLQTSKEAIPSVLERDRTTELTIDFRQGGNAFSYIADGWSGQERNHVWSVGGRSTLILPPLEPDRDYQVNINVAPCLFPPAVAMSSFSVKVGGELVSTFLLTGPQTVEFLLRREIISPHSRLVMEFEHPDFTRPCDHGHEDSRELAIRFWDLTIAANDKLQVLSGQQPDKTATEASMGGRELASSNKVDSSAPRSSPALALEQSPTHEPQLEHAPTFGANPADKPEAGDAFPPRAIPLAFPNIPALLSRVTSAGRTLLRSRERMSNPDRGDTG